MIYLFDTSAFITWWNEIYPIQSFPDIKKLIEQGIKQGNIKSAVEVKREMSLQDDDLFKWAKNRKDLFIKDEESLQSRIAVISNKYPKLVKLHRKYNADPVIIALAEANNYTVVTQENPNKQNNIVSCCRENDIRCIALAQYINNNLDELQSIRRDLQW